MDQKFGKASGPDGLFAEHLKWGGETLHLWLLNVFNFIDLEEVPACFKLPFVWSIKGVGEQ